ncbi:MAG: AAA family ATPase [Armatimonadota bacterium]
MKPLKLIIENINSLRGRHTIDFTTGNLAGCGLFAIIGPTGSGKTTILDAITLALYGQACRYGGKSSPADVMTTNTASSEATLLFSSGDMTYEASWRLRRARGAADGALQPVEVMLKRIAKDGSITVLAEQITRMKAEVDHILGINYDQFQRVALLPQGEFDRFLTAKDDERTQILEKLTGTAKYREIGELIRKAFKQAAAGSKTLRDNISGLQIGLLAPDDLKAKTERLVALDVIVPKAKLEADELAARSKAAEDYFRAIGLEGSYVTDLTKAQESLKAHQPQVARLTRFRALKPVFDARRDQAGATMRLSTAEADHKSAVGTANQAVALAGITRSQVLHYGRETMRTGLLAASGAAEALGWKPLASISDAISVVQPIAAELNAIYTALPQVARSSADAESAWQLLWKQMNQVQSVVEAAGLDREPLEHSDRERAAMAIELAYTSMLATLDDQVTRERRTVDALIQSVASLTKVAELEDRLVQGSECPLCRQTVNIVPTKGTSDAELEETKASLTTAQTELKRLESRIQRANDLMTKLSRETGMIATWLTATARAQLDSSKLDALFLAVNLNPAVRGVDRIDTHIAAMTHVLSYSAAEALLRRVQSDGRDSNDVAAADQPAPAWTSMEKAFETYSRRVDDLTKAESAVNATWEQVQQHTAAAKLAADHLEKQQLAHSVQDLAELDAIILTDADCKAIETQRERLISDESVLTGKLQEVRQAIAALKAIQPPLPVTRELVDALVADAAAKRQVSNDAIAEQSSVARDVSNDANVRDQLAELERKLAEQTKDEGRWKLLDDKFGGDKLTRLVQRIGMDALLGYANQRLQSFSNRYQLRGVDTDGLGILVVDRRNLDATRATSSLSGGEKFLTSLSLALGLSDIASRSARIDSLFIDEGFGTLDAETLETALSALQLLRTDTGRQVGIISHVGALQERLQARIVVHPNGDGTSRLAVS